jgi:site-specific DNA-methyltransferase (adenine-specific)
MNILCGDCLEIMPGLPDGSIDMILVDTPFGATANRWDAVIPLTPMWEQCRRVIRPYGAIVHFAVDPYSSMLVSSHATGYKHKWIWNKRQSANFAVAKYQPLSVFEEILVFTRNGERVNYYPQMTTGKTRMRGSRNSDAHGRGFGGMKQIYYESDQYHPVNILEFAAVPRQHSLHPSQKPVDLLAYLIRTYTQLGETVLDFCMGSGSTGVAAIQEGRRFIGIEKDAAYFEIARQRMERVSAQYTQAMLMEESCQEQL